MKKTTQGFITVVLAVLLALLLYAVPGARRALAQAGELVDGVFTAGSAPAQPQAVSAPVAPQVGQGVVTLGAEAFRPYNPAAPLARNALLVYVNSLDSNALDAPLNLPQGARIIQVVMYYYDNDLDRDMTVQIITSPNYEFYGQSVGLNASFGATNAILEATITTFSVNPSPVVDNVANNYFVRVTVSGGNLHQLKSVRVEYSFDTNLPAVMK